MRGRKPKSPQLRALQGNPGHRRLDMTATSFTAGTPEKPHGLDPDASQEWDRLTQSLAGILSPADRGVLYCACDAYAQMVQAIRVIETHGATYTTCSENGSTLIRQRPEVRMRENARQSYQLALAELGASPVGHARVHRLADAKPAKLTSVARLLG